MKPIKNIAMYISSMGISPQGQIILWQMIECYRAGNVYAPGVQRISQYIGKKRRMTLYILRWLENHGYIERIRRGKKLNTIYMIGKVIKDLISRCANVITPKKDNPKPQYTPISHEENKRKIREIINMLTGKMAM